MPAPALRANARSSRGNAPAGTTPSRPPARLSENVGCSAMLSVYLTAFLLSTSQKSAAILVNRGGEILINH
jgi:hypothetical protein